MTGDKPTHGWRMIQKLVYGVLITSVCAVTYAETLVARGVYVGHSPRDTDPYEVGFRFKTGDEP